MAPVLEGSSTRASSHLCLGSQYMAGCRVSGSYPHVRARRATLAARAVRGRETIPAGARIPRRRVSPPKRDISSSLPGRDSPVLSYPNAWRPGPSGSPTCPLAHQCPHPPEDETRGVIPGLLGHYGLWNV